MNKIIIITIIIILISGCLTTPEILIRRHDQPPSEEYFEITIEELMSYPAIEKAIHGEGCEKFDENSWRCKTNWDDVYKAMDFTNERRLSRGIGPNSSLNPSFKIGDKYYEIAYLVD